MRILLYGGVFHTTEEDVDALSLCVDEERRGLGMLRRRRGRLTLTGIVSINWGHQ